MTFKKDKNLICDVCGSPVKWAVGKRDTNAFACSNPDCGRSAKYETAPEGELPDFVVVKKNTYKIKEF